MTVRSKENSDEQEVYAIIGDGAFPNKTRIYYLVYNGFFTWERSNQYEILYDMLPDDWVFFLNKMGRVDLNDWNEMVFMNFDWYIGPKILLEPLETIVKLTISDIGTQQMFRDHMFN